MSFYDFQLKLLDGKELPFSEFKNHPVLIVNTATHCGFTPQYKALEKLWLEYQPKGLRILAIPSNDFGQQTPGTNEEIANFCDRKFHVTFPQTQCYPVKGEHAIDLFKWLDQHFSRFGRPKWNFYKYLIDSQGQPCAWYPSIISPASWFIHRKINKLLKS